MSEQTSKAKDAPPFMLGLTLAGSISAGAYLAGVVDFLIRALEAHEAANPDRPVVLKVVSGTSGGGTSASLLVASLLDGIEEGEAFDYATQGGGRATCRIALKRLHRLWVDELSLESAEGRTGMLDLADLDRARAKGRPIPSLLSGLAIDRAADRALAGTCWTRDAGYGFLAQPLDLFITTTNLQGVVYGVEFGGGGRHTMSRHGVARHFAVEGLGAHKAGSAWLEAYRDAGVSAALPKEKGGEVDLSARSKDRPATGWTALRESAIASGAFPVGFPARFVPARMQEHGLFDGAKTAPGGAWPLDAPLHRKKGTAKGALPDVMPQPNWGENGGTAEGDATYVAIDGGVINNEPFEYARYTLRQPKPKAGRHEADWLAPNPRGAAEADRAVIMVDAFPEGGVFATASDSDEDDVAAAGLPGVIGGMFGALLSQARFKPAELVAAYDADIKSRFMIAPSRDPKGDEAPVYSSTLLACGAMGGFSGFLDRRFREHDFILGQRNCQWFLKRHFTLARRNPFFRGAGKWSGKPGEHRPILALPETLSRTIEAPALPKMTLAELAKLSPEIAARADGLAETALASAGPSWLARTAVRAWWGLTGRKLTVGFVQRSLEAALVEHGLLQIALEPEGDRSAARLTPFFRKVLGRLIAAGSKGQGVEDLLAALARSRRKIGRADALPPPAGTRERQAIKDILRLLETQPADAPWRLEQASRKGRERTWRLSRHTPPSLPARLLGLGRSRRNRLET